MATAAILKARRELGGQCLSFRKELETAFKKEGVKPPIEASRFKKLLRILGEVGDKYRVKV